MQSTSASPSSPVNQSTTTVAGAGGRSTVVSTLADVSSRALLLSGSLQHSSIQPPPSSPRKNHSGGNTIKEELAVPSPRSSGRHPTNEISSSSMRFFQEPSPPTATVRRTVAFAASHSRDEELQQLRIKKKQGKGGATGENDEGDDGTVLVRIHHKTGFTHVVVPAALAANASSSITGTASTASIDSATINDGDCRHATVSHQLSGDHNPDSPHHPHPHHSHGHNRRSSAAVDKLRAFIRYKERKYDAINRLNRIGAFLVVFLFLNSVCRALGLSNESVYSITRHVAGVREGFGVFRNCENTAVFDTCHTWYDYPTSHIDARCHISNLHHKVNVLWTFAIMDCACVGAALLMALITAFRPTRSKFHMAILCLCFLSVPFGIVTLVMYSHLVSCAKGQCAGIAECDEGFNWGFYVLIVAVISSFISGSFASSMRSYVFILKREANKESRMERRIRREQQEQWQRLQEQMDANNVNNANNTNNEDAATDHPNIVFPPLADDIIGATREGGNSNAPFASASDENGVVIETHRRVDDNSDDDDDDADEGDERRALLINCSRVRHQHRRVSSTNNAAAATNAAEISQSFRTDLRSPQADTPSAASSNIAAAIAAAGANAALTSHLQHHNSPSSSHNARNRRRSQGEFSLHSNSDNMSPSSSMRLEQQQQQHNNNLSSLLSEQTPSASRGATPQQQSTPFEHAAGLWKEGEETPRGTMLASQQQHRNTGRQRGEHGRTRSAVLSSSTELNNNVASNHSAQAGGGRSGNSSPRGGQRPPPLRHKHSRSSGGAGGGGESGEQILNTTTSALNASSMRMSVTVGLIPPQYITAAEMGVEIAGSDDWVYAEQADMYYSFALEMFWDPINREYYNCRLGRWQEVM